MTDTLQGDPRLDPAIVPSRTAIILIDLQNDIIRNPNGPFYGAIAEQVRERQVVERVVRLTDGARAAGALIFYVTVVRRKDYGDVVNQITELVAAGKAPPPKQQVSLVEGTPGAQLVGELVPQSGDYVLVKKRRNAFHQTELDFHLRARGITTLAIGGVATDLGVENTVRDAWDRDYNVIVLDDISVAVPPSAHDYAITSVFPRMARIMSSERLLSELARNRGR
jgi:nicotinamidase-related amidase